MAKTKISEFSATAADNTDITNINIAEEPDHNIIIPATNALPHVGVVLPPADNNT